MASPKKYRAKLARVHVRVLWMQVQNTKSANRTHEDWLSAANRELEPLAEVKLNIGGTVTMKAIEKPTEVVELLLSFEATCGIKLAIAKAMDASFRTRQELLEAVAGFGEEFHKMCRKAMRLPESPDVDEDEELKDIPCVEDEPKKFTPVLVDEPTKIPAPSGAEVRGE